MPFQTTKPGIREATKDAILGLMRAKIPDLQAAMNGISPSVLTGVAVSPNQFYFGDFDTLPDPATNPFWVTVEGGGKNDSTDAEYSQHATGANHEWEFWTNIYWYLHPTLFPTSGAAAQAEERSRFRDRFHDWLVGDVLNTYSAHGIALGSYQFNGVQSEIPDNLRDCMVRRVTAAWAQKSFGASQWVYYLHFCHYANAYGPA